jgi:transcriptional regulator with XRE-family HTH domain
MSREKTIITNNILFAKNISKIVDDNGGPYTFAMLIGVSYDAVRQWRIGENLPDGKRLLAIRAKFGISTDWLLAGEDPTPVKIAGVAESRAAYDTNATAKPDPCPVKCDEKLRKLCARVKKVMEPDDGFSKALEANIYAFEESADMKKEIQNIKKTSSMGPGGGIPQTLARPTAKKRKAG